MPVPIAGGTPAIGEPSFGNTLSSGDRNTLALAFFFASLDQDPDLASRVVVIDDPASSLDEHRTLTTVHELRRLSERVTQLVVLSHNRPFLCRLWEGADRDNRAALEIARDGTGSTLRSWEVSEASVTEHDRRDLLFRTYLAGDNGRRLEVARALRPHLEAFLRVACPEHFPPGRLLGQFMDICRQRVGTQEHVLAGAEIVELGNLTDYANRFHHDTNPAWQTAQVNDAELLGFLNRTRAFTGLG